MPSQRKIVSEKTLELNVAADILTAVRQFPGCAAAFWMGMTQSQENLNGIDELMANVPQGYHLVLQFKAPTRNPPRTAPYRFSINDKQTGHLLRLSRTRPDAVHYVLPHYNSFVCVRAHAPNLLQDTWFLRVEDLRGLPAATNLYGRHRVLSFGGTVRVHSEPLEVVAQSHRAVLERLVFDGVPSRGGMIESPVLRQWLKSLYKAERDNWRVVGQILRGLGTAFFPV